jgi:hypothetical protein
MPGRAPHLHALTDVIGLVFEGRVVVVRRDLALERKEVECVQHLEGEGGLWT